MTPLLVFILGETLLIVGMAGLLRMLCMSFYRRGRYAGICETRVDVQIERGHAEARKRNALGQYRERRYGYFPAPTHRL